MRKLILNLAVSLDGYIEGPNGEYDWCFDDGNDYGMITFLESIDAMFVGRKSYELLRSMGDKSGLPPIKQYVFSTTLNEVEGDGEIIADKIVSKVKEIKSSPGKDIWLFGGAGLTSSLLNLNLVDEFSLAIHPILLGSGTKLVTDIHARVPLKLLDVEKFDSGLVIMRYAV